MLSVNIFVLLASPVFWFTVQSVLVGHFIKIVHLVTKLHIEFPCFYVCTWLFYYLCICMSIFCYRIRGLKFMAWL